MAQRNTSNLATVLAEALGRPPQERAAFLDRACAGDAAMRRDLDDLLSAHGKAGEFLNRPAAGPEALRSVATLNTAPHDDVGSVIDRYKLLQLIGEGGFGSVFMAEQAEPVRRMVALKVIKLGMDTRQVIARFEVERQALAMMDHPNIARVLDAGATAAGRPYFVMELVKGIPITHYCDQNNLDTRSRLGLFITVCQAVQHAHQKGVIHRDIKPSNVLVTLHDGVPVPKVIDFGIAKATSARLTEKTLFTEFRQLIGTPEYMSPEQAEVSGLDIDTRSDVYSLGVLLYELLTGTTPFDSRTLRSAGYAEIQRIIREVEPQRPSTRLSTMGEALPGVAAHRATEPRKLGSIVRGELDWIVMKALEKDRTRRYDTANGMASDVQRYLANEPVTAGPPSTTYRLRKFVRRNRGAVLAASLLLAAMLAGIAGTTVGLLRAMRSERDQAELVKLATQQLDALGERFKGMPTGTITFEGREQPVRLELMINAGDSPREQISNLGASAQLAVDGLIKMRERAEIERDKSNRIAEFMETTLAGAGPIVAVGRDTTMLREMMDSAAKRIADGELRSSPEAELRLRLTIGDVYRQLSAYERAEGMLRPAVELSRQVHAGDHETTAQALNQLAITLDAQRKLEDALETSQAAMDMARRLHPDDHEMVAGAMIAHAEVLHELNHTAECEAMMRDGIAMYERLGEGEGMFVGEGLKTLAAIARERGDLEAAEPLYRKAFEIHRRNIVGDHPALAAILQSLGMLYYDRRDFEQAEQYFRASLEMHERLFQGDHINIARNLDALAGIARGRNDYPEAVRLLERSMEMRQRLVGADSLDMASSMKNLAVMKYEMKDLDGAETLARDALAICRRQLPIDHSDTQGAMWTLAIVLQDKGDVAGSIDLRRELLESQRRSNPGDSVVVARTMAQLGLSLLQAGKPVEAETVLRECLAMRTALAKDANARPPQPSWHVASTMSGLGEALIAQAEDQSLAMESRLAKVREAEQLVVEGYTTMEADPATPRGGNANAPGAVGDNRVREALDRVIRLYETWDKIEPGQGHADKAKEWREKASGSERDH